MIRDDPAPVVLSGGEGTILAQNAAARARIGEPTRCGHVAHAFAGFFPTPPPSSRARPPPCGTRDSAVETVLTPRGPVRIVVTRTEAGILWRLDDIREPHASGEGIGLPMMTVSRSDTILSANAAMRELLGRPLGALAEVFPDQPLVPGRRTRMVCGDAAVEVVPIVLSADDGRREIYAVPGLAEPPAASVAARAFEMLPVASLHIGADGQVLASNRQAQTLLAIGPEEAGTCRLAGGRARPARAGLGRRHRGGADADTGRGGPRQTPQRRVFPADRAQPDHRCRGAVASGRSARRDRTQEPRTAIRAKPEDAGRGRTRRRRGA
jgi:two-component system cell cycle sensor histidine kinase/response regulator CckA